jgi:hypothetical protein
VTFLFSNNGSKIKEKEILIKFDQQGNLVRVFGFTLASIDMSQTYR